MLINTSEATISGAELGPTLMHEHVLVNLTREYRGNGLLNNEELMVQELDFFVSAGGRSLVELTPAELTVGAAPDPAGVLEASSTDDHGWPSRTPSSLFALRRIARASGVNLVLGTGHYRDPYLAGSWIDSHSVDQVAEMMVADIEEGMSGTDIKAGIIGEIGADKWYISALEERSFRAAARAQVRTGVALTTHAARWPVGIAQLDLMAEEGVDPRRVVIGHCDSVPIPAYHLAIAKRGAFVQFDNIRNESSQQVEQGVRLVRELVEAGFSSHILFSHDVCTTSHLRSAGGCGFDFVLTQFRDQLIDAGIPAEVVVQITEENPRRVLTGE